MNREELVQRLRDDCAKYGAVSPEALAMWPNCAVPDCPNKSSLRLGSDKCHPHTTGEGVIPWNKGA